MPQLPRAVARPHARDEPELGSVGELHGVRLVVERHRREHRAEHLLAREPRRRRARRAPASARRSSPTTAHSATIVPCPAIGSLSRVASARKPRTRSSCVARISGPQSRSSSAGPDRQRAKRRREPLEQLVVARALDQQPAARRARLPGVLHDRVDDHRDRRVEIGVGEHDLRTLAAELERHRAVALRRFLRDQRAGRRRAGERQVVDARMLREREPGLAAEPGDDVERAVGEAGAGRELGDAQERQARVLGRLDDARVARRERAAHAAPEDLHRVVPRDDVAGDAVRLAPRQHRVAGRVGNRLAVQLVGRAAVELEVARARDDVGARLLHRLAAIARLEPRELVGVVGDRARERHEPAALLDRRELAPRAVERRARGAHGRVDVRPRRRARSTRTACRRTGR